MVSVALLSYGFGMAVEVASANAEPTTDVPAATPEMTAQAEAERTGQSVVVGGSTTEYSQVVANPDDTFTAESSRSAVRALVDGAWRPIDTDLHAQDGGRLTPAVTTIRMTFSGGGAGPMVTVGDPSASEAISWNGNLPAPTISGNVATYANVLPDVDLLLTAHAEDFSEVLVVHNAAAAANPALSALHFPTTVDGLSLVPADGGASAVDDAGSQVFHAATPMMWDSHVDSRVGPEPTAQDAGSGDVTALTATVQPADGTDHPATVTQTVTAPAPALTGTDVVYPVYIDPDTSATKNHTAVVFNHGWHYFDTTTNDLKVGDCPQSTDSSCNGIGVGRSYFTLDTTGIINKPTTAKIYSASLQAYETHNSAACTAEPVDLWTARGVNSSTSWPGPYGSVITSASSNRSDTCASSQPGYVQFNVLDQVQNAANNDYPELGFALFAHNEADENQWKRFAAWGDYAPSITIVFSFPPSTPTNLSVKNAVTCPGKPVYSRSRAPVLRASATNYNAGQQLHLYFGVDDNPVTRQIDGTVSGGLPTTSNAITDFDIAGGYSTKHVLPEGNLQFAVYANNLDPNDETGATTGYSALYPFTIDDEAPDQPTVSSFDYPANYWGAPQSTPGTIRFTSSTDTAGFLYTFQDAGTEPSLPDTECNYNVPGQSVAALNGVASVTPPTTLPPGYHTVRVESFDGAHNISDESSAYTFYIAPTETGEGPTTREAENLPVTSTATCGTGSPACFYDEGTSSRWSNDEQEHLLGQEHATNAVDCGGNACRQFTFAVAAPVGGDYAFGIQMTRVYHYGIAQFKIDDQLVRNQDGSPVEVDCYKPQADGVDTVYQILGGRHWDQSSTHTITVAVWSKNPNATSYNMNGTYGGVTYQNYPDGGYALGVDSFTVTPLNGATGSFTSLRNNVGISDGTRQADFGPSTQNYGIPTSQLAAADMAPGTSFTVGGDTTMPVDFTIAPAAQTGGADNIVASGQTIQLSNPVTSKYLNLLVASTCGATNPTASPKFVLSMGVTDGTTATAATAAFPTVPDWQDGSGSTSLSASVTSATPQGQLTKHYEGSNLVTGTSPIRLYRVRLKTSLPDGYEVTSVVLPNFGTTFIDDGSCSSAGIGNAALHVFAISGSN